jgi:phosphate transport system ATP-binding protein
MQQAARISDWAAFFMLGEVIEYNRTGRLFNSPQHPKTEAYLTGRFG